LKIGHVDLAVGSEAAPCHFGGMDIVPASQLTWFGKIVRAVWLVPVALGVVAVAAGLAFFHQARDVWRWLTLKNPNA
jgi:hypothetical protein